MRKVLLALAAAIIGVAAFGQPAANKPKKVPKNEAEAKLINQVVAEANPAKRLTELDEWVKEFPESDWNAERPTLYLITYQQLPGKSQEAFDTANKILGTNPNDFLAISAVLRLGLTLNNKNPTPADLDEVEKVCEYVMANPDKVFANSNRPETISAAEWPKVGPYWGPQSKAILVATYLARKDDARAEEKLKEKAQAYPSDPVFALALVNLYFTQIKAHPERQPLALFYWARAASIDGKQALSAAEKQKYMASFTRNYTTYHGSSEGLDAVIALAKADPVAPADFKILSTVDIAKAKADEEAKEAAANPAMALWKTIKTGLTGDNPDQFFEGSVKDAELPGKDPSTQADLKWKGKLVSMKPTIRPKTLVIAVEKPEGDVTLNLDMPLPGKMEPGAELEFEGQAKAYVKDPYMLTLETEKAKIEGWKPIPTPMQHKKSGAKKGAR